MALSHRVGVETSLYELRKLKPAKSIGKGHRYVGPVTRSLVPYLLCIKYGNGLHSNEAWIGTARQMQVVSKVVFIHATYKKIHAERRLHALRCNQGTLLYWIPFLVLHSTFILTVLAPVRKTVEEVGMPVLNSISNGPPRVLWNG